MGSEVNPALAAFIYGFLGGLYLATKLIEWVFGKDVFDKLHKEKERKEGQEKIDINNKEI